MMNDNLFNGFYRNKFTSRVISVIEEAKRITYENKAKFLTPNEIVYAMLTSGDSFIEEIIYDLNINKENILKKIKLAFRTAQIKKRYFDDIETSEEIGKCLDLAFDSAISLDDSTKVDIPHLLIGILRADNSEAATILLNNGLSIGYVKEFYLNFKGFKFGFAPASKLIPRLTPHSQEKDLFLNKFSIDITQLAKNNKLDPVIGREEELDRIIRILGRRKKNNPLLIGEPGVGKSTLVNKLAQAIVNKSVPKFLWSMKIKELDLNAIVAGTKYRGQFEDRMRKIVNDLKKNNNIILFIDEIQTIMETGNSENGLNAGNILKPLLASGDVRCIGATTLDEYKRFFEKNTAMDRRFHKVLIEPTPIKDTIEILKGLREKYENYHNVHISDEAINTIVKLSNRFINDQYNPDKSIDILDEACVWKKFEIQNTTPGITELKEEIETLEKTKDAAVNKQDFTKASQLRDEINYLRKQLKELIDGVYSDGIDYTVTEKDVAYVISQISGVPITELDDNDVEHLKNLENTFKNKIIGQEHAINIVSRALRRSRTGVRNPNQPIGVFLFLGPTGVGKTELAKVIAEEYFHDKLALIRINMSEYMEKFAVSRLVGAPPGYVGFENGGQITEKVRHKPYSVVLFDEIEKADPDVYNILLQIFDEGVITDSTGKNINFKNTIIIMTSNIGAKKIQDSGTIGFQSEALIDNYTDMTREVMEEVRNSFNPEFINRISDIVIFRPLNKEDIRKIIDLIFSEVQQRLMEKSIIIELDDSVKDFLIEKGYNKMYGARPLRRAIEHYLEDFIAEQILYYHIKEGDRVRIFMNNGEFDFNIEEREDDIFTISDNMPPIKEAKNG